MEYTTHSEWLTQFIRSSTVIAAGRANEFYRAARAGRFVRLAEGVYLPEAVWRHLDHDARFLARVHAAARASRDGVVFSHFSAAALWKLPVVGPWPLRPEVVVGSNAAGPSRKAFTARQFPIPQGVDVIDGLRVTPLARTLVDVARSAPLTVSVPMLDAGLSGRSTFRSADPHELRSDLEAATTPRGRARARLALELADGGSGSVGESLSRVAIHQLGLPAPLLQQAFHDRLGLIGYVDFWWPEANLIGEFDGEGKYLRSELRGDRDAGQVVVAEKIREDRLRALGHRVCRWGWDEARSLPLLGARLRAAGL